MPRTERLEFENAFYHVINRGRERQKIFHDENYYHAFLQTLKESHERFDAVIHAYCLMGNHYHLLIETPRANISRIMRHINGVYTQRYNRLKKTDGPLFRGRFKSILVDEDAYLLQLTRYIHRNPIEVKYKKADLESYPWSSYRAYINLEKPEDWLERETAYSVLGKRNRYQGYRVYVEQGIDEDIKRFYNKGNIASVLGNYEFRQEILERAGANLSDVSKLLNVRPEMNEICQAVANVYKVSYQSLIEFGVNRKQGNFPRKLAIYLCQQIGDKKLTEIAEFFNLKSMGSVSPAIADVKKVLKEGPIKELRKIEKHLNIIK